MNIANSSALIDIRYNPLDYLATKMTIANESLLISSSEINANSDISEHKIFQTNTNAIGIFASEGKQEMYSSILNVVTRIYFLKYCYDLLIYIFSF